jgi:hypothetical protein
MSQLPASTEVVNEERRWGRAASWACGQSLGPWVQSDDEIWKHECRRIEALRDRILEIGEQAGYEELFGEPPEWVPFTEELS